MSPHRWDFISDKHGLDTKPIPTDTGRELTQSLGEAGVLTGLYSKAMWPALWQAIQQAESGDGTILLAVSDALFQRCPDGHYTNYHDASARSNAQDLWIGSRGVREGRTFPRDLQVTE
ncbi:hypothetical protein [Streptomyces sp. HUAS TT20]|uniref:hypothetical protein n=1 Tax=Streptomyces sp. HUAS TT20 TaxID=3447509 RepID=UPI0021D8E470|nr:hypothetical protein [Streptomyces sp. HUAS 15-9]UXY32160.1 hypothetical protein N8I87_40285 [Streptomyces sp. HUAS 15-9]